MQRFFVDFPLSIDLVLTDPDLHNQITRVLRMKIGESVILFDGDGSETVYQIQSIDKKSIALRGTSRVFPETESSKQIALYQALPNKYEKIEYILQKGIEVGIQKFYFFRSDRSQKLLLSPNKIERFMSIAREAVEQCGGLKLPEIEFSDTFSPEQVPGIHLVLDTTGPLCRTTQFIGEESITLYVGPEWGWSEEERTKMRDKGFIFAHFSKRVFRTETAGVVVSFAFMNG
jgi:16S rRNA (uracil1498-N3)-methyltransferase